MLISTAHAERPGEESIFFAWDRPKLHYKTHCLSTSSSVARPITSRYNHRAYGAISEVGYVVGKNLMR